MNTCCDVRDRIVHVDCEYHDGQFVMQYLPGCMPTVFTARFKAPADFTKGNTIVVKGVEMPVMTSQMEAAGTGTFKTGAVMMCEIDLDRKLAFIHTGSAGDISIHQCYYPRIDLYLTTTGSDESGDGSELSPLRSVYGALSLLEQRYCGTIKILNFHLGKGYFSAPCNWFTAEQGFEVNSVNIYGENTETDTSATIIGDLGCRIGRQVTNVSMTNVSFTCNDDTNTFIVRTEAKHTIIYGACQIRNTSAPKFGIAVYYNGYLEFTGALRFEGAFTSAIYSTCCAKICFAANAWLAFLGESDCIMYVNGGSTMYILAVTPPTFHNGFKGNIRARNGSTIVFNSTLPSGSWLPSGSQWVKDSTSQISGH